MAQTPTQSNQQAGGPKERRVGFAPRGALNELKNMIAPPQEPNAPKKKPFLGIDMGAFAHYTLVGATGFATDAATGANMLTEGGFDVRLIAPLAVAERFDNMQTEELVDQAMLSVSVAADEIVNGQISRGAMTPPVLLYMAEKVMEVRGVKEKTDFLGEMFKRCAALLKEYDGRRDAEGMIVARMVHLATEGIVANSLKADQAQGLKGEHTVDMAVRQLNATVQEYPEEMVTGLGIFVSTPQTRVFGVPKAERQVDVANELLFTNRGIITQRVLLGEEPVVGKITTMFSAGMEFLEGDNYDASHKGPQLPSPNGRHGHEAATEQQLEWHRLNWFAIVQNLHPGIFGEALKIVDPARAENRLMVKPEKYSPGRDNVLTAEVKSPLVAFALTNHWRPVHERMQTVTISEATPKSKHGMTQPVEVVKALRQGMFPTAHQRKQIGEYTKLVDKYGPFNAKASLATLPALMSQQELEQVYCTVEGRLRAGQQGNGTEVKIIGRDKLPEVAGQLAHVAQSFLEATIFEIYGNRNVRDNELVANFTAAQLYVVSRMLEQGVYHNEDAVRGLHARMNDMLIEMLTGPQGSVSEPVAAVARFVYENSLPNFPEAARKDFLKKVVERGLADRNVFDHWAELMRPLMLREQSFIPAGENELYGVRPEWSKEVLQISRILFNAMPDLQDKPELFMDMLLRGDGDFVAQVLQLAWVVGNRTQLPHMKLNGKDRKRLAEMNAPVQALTRDAITRLEYELARRLRMGAPYCIRGELSSLVDATERLSGDTMEGQQHFLEAFAAMNPLFQKDVMVIDNDGSVRVLTLPNSIPGMEAGGIYDLSVGEDARKLGQAMSLLVDNQGQGEIPQLVAAIEGKGNAPTSMADAIVTQATNDASARNQMILKEATAFFEAALGPNSPEGDEKSKGGRRKRTHAITNSIWVQNGGYGRTVGLIAALAANNQALAQGAKGVEGLVQSLLDAEVKERNDMTTLTERTGGMDVVRSASDIAVSLNRMALQRVTSAQEAYAMSDRFRNGALDQAQTQLQMIQVLQAELATLQGRYDQESLTIADARLRLRQEQIEQAIQFAQQQIGPILAQVYRERGGIITRLAGMREKLFSNQVEVIDWLMTVVDDQGDFNQLRFSLMEAIRSRTGTDNWWISAPSVAMIQSYSAMTNAPAGEVDHSRGSVQSS